MGNAHIPVYSPDGPTLFIGYELVFQALQGPWGNAPKQQIYYLIFSIGHFWIIIRTVSLAQRLSLPHRIGWHINTPMDQQGCYYLFKVDFTPTSQLCSSLLEIGSYEALNLISNISANNTFIQLFIFAHSIKVAIKALYLMKVTEPNKKEHSDNVFLITS